MTTIPNRRTLSSKTTSDGQSRPTPKLPRHVSFLHENDPAAAPILGPSSTQNIGAQPSEDDTLTSDDMANTSFRVQQPNDVLGSADMDDENRTPDNPTRDNSVSVHPASKSPSSDNPTLEDTTSENPALENLVRENPVLVGLRKTAPSFLLPSTRNDHSAQKHAAPLHPIQIGNFLGQLEIRWNETCKDLDKIAQLASDFSLPQDQLEWCRNRCAYLQGQERSLRHDIRRLTPLPPLPLIPEDPNLVAYHVAYQAAATAYSETVRAYWNQRSTPSTM
ncbi:MAG: hypothetical protein J3R72DRAFT_452291, partial [Linnemannia gamsii]